MKGTLVVTEGGGTAATAAEGGHSHAAGAGQAATNEEMDAIMGRSIKAFPAKTQGVGGRGGGHVPLPPQRRAPGPRRPGRHLPGRHQGEWIQVHYMNEGMMAHPMHLHGMAQTVIAKDGFPLAQPYEADTINVSPGERFTVLIHATEVGTWVWHCHILTHAESMEKGMFGMVTALVVA